MASKYADDFRNKPMPGGEFGNACTFDFFYDGAAAQNDKIYLGVIPAGTRIDELRLLFEDCGTGVTLDVGYEPADGVSPSTDGDYWIDGTDVATGAGSTLSLSTAVPLTFEKDVYVVATVLGAAFTGTPRIDVILRGQRVGVK